MRKCIIKEREMTRNDYEEPRMVKVGNVKDLTLGGQGSGIDAGAGSVIPPTREIV
jgi:hypothetical protein